MEMGNRGQGSLEYLLLIGGAIVVAVIVIVLLLNSSSSQQTQTQTTTIASFCTENMAVKGNSGACSVATACFNHVTYACGGTYPNCTAGASSTVTC